MRILYQLLGVQRILDEFSCLLSSAQGFDNMNECEIPNTVE